MQWAESTPTGTNWLVAHLYLGPDGGPVIENIARVIDDGPGPSAHVMGAALGPDGRAYMVTFYGGYGPADGATPLRVWIQDAGPTMSVPLGPVLPT